MGPFSPFSSSSSSHSISPSTRNLNILNETTFNINNDGSNDSDNDTNYLAPSLFLQKDFLDCINLRL